MQTIRLRRSVGRARKPARHGHHPCGDHALERHALNSAETGYVTEWALPTSATTPCLCHHSLPLPSLLISVSTRDPLPLQPHPTSATTPYLCDTIPLRPLHASVTTPISATTPRLCDHSISLLLVSRKAGTD